MNLEVRDLPEGYVMLDAIVLIKVLNAEGEVRFIEQFGKTLNLMERYGMTTSARDTVQRQLNATTRGHGDG